MGAEKEYSISHLHLIKGHKISWWIQKYNQDLLVIFSYIMMLFILELDNCFPSIKM